MGGTVSWFDWILLGWWAIGAILTISCIDKPRKPTTPGVAILVLIINVALTLGLLWTRGVL